jgi:universal stress protein E
MRSHDRDLAAAPRPFGPVDMELLRRCPCPVLLVRQGAGGPHPRMVAAINSSTDEECEHALNRKIVEMTLRLSELEQGLPIVLQAWAPFAEGLIRDHSSADDFAAYVSGVRERTAADLRRFVQSVSSRGMPIQTVHRRGEPEDVILEFVVSEGVDVVVMGTKARSGIAGVLIGNTAERVLRRLPCSVLAVKPDGFISPERLEAD